MKGQARKLSIMLQLRPFGLFCGWGKKMASLIDLLLYQFWSFIKRIKHKISSMPNRET
jgi:hypothetical protein